MIHYCFPFEAEVEVQFVSYIRIAADKERLRKYICLLFLLFRG